MQASEIFHKTAKGQSEIATKSSALSLKERRVLILVNGVNNAARLKAMSLCDNIAEILETLLSHEFIESATPAPASEDTDTTQPTETDLTTDFAAAEFMANTLLTFANRVRVAKLLDQIGSAASIAELKELVKPWYHAISETPGGMYQADDLRKEVLDMLNQQESSGLG